MSTIDWIDSMWPALQRFLAGGNPYAIGTGWNWFANPPWILPMLVPFGWLGPWGGYALSLLALTGIVALCVKLIKPTWKAGLAALLIVASVPVLTLLTIGNVDGFVLWGLVAGGPLGLLLLSVKPQVASLVGLVWMWQAYKSEGWKGVVKLVWPTVAIAIVSTALYPQWISAVLSAPTKQGATVNLWPWLVAPGLYLLYRSLRSGKPANASVATGLISPYLGMYSWSASLVLVVAENLWIGTALSLLSWVYLYMHLKGVI